MFVSIVVSFPSKEMMCDRKWEDMAFAVNSSSWTLKWKINRNVLTSSRVCCLVSISLLPKSIFPFSQYQNGLFKMNGVIWTQLCACSEKPLRSAGLHCLQEVSSSLKNSLQNHILLFSLTQHSQQEDNFILPILLYPNFSVLPWLYMKWHHVYIYPTQLYVLLYLYC